jgi:hypothetical protein
MAVVSKQAAHSPAAEDPGVSAPPHVAHGGVTPAFRAPRRAL